MSLSLSLRLQPQAALRQTLKLEQRLALQMKLIPPSSFSWEEPAPRTERLCGPQGTYLEISEEDLISYAQGCAQLASIIENEKPTAILVSLRGGLPPARIALSLSRLKPPIIYLKTSYFLKNLGRFVVEALEKCSKLYSPKSDSPLLYLDTSVTGTKIGWFLPQLKEYLTSLYPHWSLVSTILCHDPNLHYGLKPLFDEPQNTYHIGVRNILSEDTPELLGCPYHSHTDACHEKAIGETLAYQRISNPAIHVVGKESTAIHESKKLSTADLFIELVKGYCKPQ